MVLLRWIAPETVTIPNVGTVQPGILFTIEDDRAQDLIDRGMAKLFVEPKVSAWPAKQETPNTRQTTQVDAASPEKE